MIGSARFRACLLCVLLLTGCAATRAVSPSGVTAYEVSLATVQRHLALAWHGSGLAHGAIWLRFLEASGRPRGAAWPLTDGRRDAFEPDLQPFGDGLALTWYEKDPDTGALAAWLACLDRQGHEQWRHPLSPPGRNGRNPVVRVAGRELRVAWIESGGGAETAVWSARFDADGRPVQAAHNLAPASDTTWNLNAAVDAGGAFYVAYDAALGTRASEVQLLKVTAAGVERMTPGADDGIASVYPDIAIDGDRLAMAWTDLRAGGDTGEIRLGVGALTAADWARHAVWRDVTTGAGTASAVYLAWNGSRLAVAWNQRQGDVTRVWGRILAADGAPAGAATPLSRGGANAWVPAVRSWGNGFVVAWNEADVARGGVASGAVRRWPGASGAGH